MFNTQCTLCFIQGYTGDGKNGPIALEARRAPSPPFVPGLPHAVTHRVETGPYVPGLTHVVALCLLACLPAWLACLPTFPHRQHLLQRTLTHVPRAVQVHFHKKNCDAAKGRELAQVPPPPAARRRLPSRSSCLYRLRRGGRAWPPPPPRVCAAAAAHGAIAFDNQTRTFACSEFHGKGTMRTCASSCDYAHVRALRYRASC